MQNLTLQVNVMLSRTRQLNLSQLKWCLRVTLRSPWVGDWREVCLFAYGWCWYWYRLTGVGYPHLPRLKIRRRTLHCYLRLQLSLRSGCGHTAVFKLHIAIFPVKSCNFYCWQNHRHTKDLGTTTINNFVQKWHHYWHGFSGPQTWRSPFCCDCQLQKPPSDRKD